MSVFAGSYKIQNVCVNNIEDPTDGQFILSVVVSTVVVPVGQLPFVTINPGSVTWSKFSVPVLVASVQLCGPIPKALVGKISNKKNIFFILCLSFLYRDKPFKMLARKTGVF